MNIHASALAHYPGFSSRSLRKLRLFLGDHANAWGADVPEMMDAGVSQASALEFSKWRETHDPQTLAKTLDARSIRTLCLEDPEYPPLLKETADPPEVLFIRGALPDIPSVAIVGSRKYTSYGRRCVSDLVSPLVSVGLRIVSGLALGIDGLAHEAALKAGNPTLAVLGSGIDDASIYPREHYRLAERMLATGGCLISEFPPGTPGLRHHFPMRNRIIAGMTLATVVVEAHEQSGSLITAKLAIDEGREVLAVPGSVFSVSSAGCHRLIAMGAKPCLNAQSVLDALSLDRPELAADVRKDMPLNPLESRVLGLLDTQRHVDELVRIDGTDAAKICSALSLLELKGCIRNVGGGAWARVGNSAPSRLREQIAS